MTAGTASPSDLVSDRSPAWGAVFAMALCCMVLVASEFMPVSLLTPIASDLHMTEGQAGQAISISGIFAVLTSLFISSLTAGRDRRPVLLLLTLLLIVSGSVVAFALAWLLMSIPSMHSERRTGSGNVFRLLRRPVVAYGMAAVTLFFMGQFALFTYLRPFLEMVTGVDVPTLSLVLLLLGVTGLVGTTLIGSFLKNGTYGVMIAIPLAMAVIAVALIAFGNWLAGTAFLLGAWGLIGTPAPVAWNTWLAKTLPRDAEAGGGLMVAAIQLAITLGATFGGFLFDMSGYQSTFGVSAAMLIAAALLAIMAKRADFVRRA